MSKFVKDMWCVPGTKAPRRSESFRTGADTLEPVLGNDLAVTWAAAADVYGPSATYTVQVVAPGTLQLTPDPSKAEYAKGLSFALGPRLEAFTLESATPEPPDRVTKHITFTMVEEKDGREVSVPYSCMASNITKEGYDQMWAAKDEARARERSAEAAAEQQKASQAQRYQQLIATIRAKGGNCPTVANHLEMHMSRAMQNGDWSGFQETLGRGLEYGC